MKVGTAPSFAERANDILMPNLHIPTNYCTINTSEGAQGCERSRNGAILDSIHEKRSHPLAHTVSLGFLLGRTLKHSGPDEQVQHTLVRRGLYDSNPVQSSIARNTYPGSNYPQSRRKRRCSSLRNSCILCRRGSRSRRSCNSSHLPDHAIATQTRAERSDPRRRSARVNPRR